MTIFATFINPAADNAGFTHWIQRIAFGEPLPSGRTSGFAHLEVDDPSQAKLFAAFSGKLSVARPTGFLQPVREEIADCVPEGRNFTLYLTPIVGKFDSEWAALGAALTARFGSMANAAAGADSIAYLEYRNVDRAKTEELLSGRLQTPKPAPKDKLWKKFLNGEGVLVNAGDEIGAAGLTGTDAAPGPPQVRIGLHTRYGMFDPGAWYQQMVTTLAGAAPAEASSLSQFLGVRMPLIDQNRRVASVGSERCWPWSALLQYKQANGLSYDEWRELGNRQKSLYLAQLMSRVRPALAPANTPRFDYDVQDMLNVFQLEAVTEFFMNLPDPWNAALQPIPPGDPAYTSINLLSLYGNDATVSNTNITLDGELDMKRIVAGRDTILLESEPETQRAGRQFRIMAVNRPYQIVTVDAAPTIPRSSWRIFHNPTLVMIDAFGSRVRGVKATADGTLNAPAVKLSQLTDAQLDELNRVNPFETISLLDVAANTPREARILERATIRKSDREATLKLDRGITPVASGSAWAIPAGVGGVQGSIGKAKKPAGNFGWDNYDGMMFLVTSGEVRCFFPWTSFSSRKSDLSSVRGNTMFHFGSVCSHKPYINMAFSVIDREQFFWAEGLRGSLVASGGALVHLEDPQPLDPDLWVTIYIPKAVPPRFVSAAGDVRSPTLLKVREKDQNLMPSTMSPYWILSDDCTRGNRFYFRKVPGSRSSLARGIRIHQGGIGENNSEGCNVSPEFPHLRKALINYHRESNNTYYQLNEADPQLDYVPQIVSEVHQPKELDEYISQCKELKALEKDLAERLANPLLAALGRVQSTGQTQEEKLAELRILATEISERQARAEARNDRKAASALLPAMEMLTKLAADEDVVTAIKWAEENAEEISRLSLRIAELGLILPIIEEYWGWTNAMHGEYFLIRPDERQAT